MGIYDALSQLESQQPKPAADSPTVRQATSQVATAPISKRNVVTPRRHDAVTGVNQPGAHGVSVSVLEGVDLDGWREVLANTETHSSTYRLTEGERRLAEDLVRDLWRTYRIKTSMNELARLGLMLLEHDFRRRKSQSIINDIKKS